MNKTIGIIGLGKMGGAILTGIIKSNLYDKDHIIIYDVNPNALEYYGGLKIAKSEEELLLNVDIVILAIKPQSFPAFLDKVEKLDLNLVVVTIAAGIKLSYLRKYFKNQQFIRVMPNTPALIRFSSIAICKSVEVSDDTFLEVIKIFSSIGIVREIKEEQMDEVIPLNGSMPAYLYYFIQAFINEGIKEGIDEETAKILACNAVIGSAEMILKMNKPIDELIKDVCSPGGTTLAGLDVLKENNFQDIIASCYKACVNRSKELGNK